jgi:hypothetical protein
MVIPMQWGEHNSFAELTHLAKVLGGVIKLDICVSLREDTKKENDRTSPAFWQPESLMS